MRHLTKIRANELLERRWKRAAVPGSVHSISASNVFLGSFTTCDLNGHAEPSRSACKGSLKGLPGKDVKTPPEAERSAAKLRTLPARATFRALSNSLKGFSI